MALRDVLDLLQRAAEIQADEQAGGGGGGAGGSRKRMHYGYRYGYLEPAQDEPLLPESLEPSTE